MSLPSTTLAITAFLLGWTVFFAPAALSQESDKPIAKADRHTLLLSDWTSPRGQTCRLDVPEDGPPPVDALVDSASLHRALAERWPAGDPGSPSGYMLFSLILQRDSTGGPARVEIIESDLPGPVQSASRALLYRRVRNPGEKVLSGRLRIELGPELRFATGAREMCRLALANRAEVTRLFESSIERADRSRTAMVWVYIDRHGSVERVRLERSSGNPGFDDLALGLAPLSSPGGAQAQDETCTYDRCALRVHHGFLTRTIVQGSEQERVARIGIFAPDLDLFAARSDSAAFYYSGFRSAHNSSVWLSIGALAAIAIGFAADHEGADELAFGSLTIGGGLVLVASIRSLQARERLSTAIWWYNRSLD